MIISKKEYRLAPINYGYDVRQSCGSYIFTLAFYRYYSARIRNAKVSMFVDIDFSSFISLPLNQFPLSSMNRGLYD